MIVGSRLYPKGLVCGTNCNCGAPYDAGACVAGFGNALTQWGAVGDSTTAVSGGTTGWPAEYGIACTARSAHNGAVPGATTTDERDSQWPTLKAAGGLHGLFVHGGFNDIKNTADSSAVIFARLQTIADDALATGLSVSFVSILPAGGNFGAAEEARRLGIMSLEASWAASHGQQFINLDLSSINCGDRYSDGANALCEFAQNNGTDLVHPSQAGEAAIGQYIATQFGCNP